MSSLLGISCNFLLCPLVAVVKSPLFIVVNANDGYVHLE